MALEFNLLQKMNQQLAMTPQLQQAIKLLQFSKADLKDAIEKELQENPVLEDLKELSDKLTSNKDEKEEKLNFNSEENNAKDNKSSEKNDWELYQERFGEISKNIHKSTKESSNVPSIENTISPKKSLHEYLIEQLRLLPITKKQEELCLEIILNLDNNGFLGLSYEELQSYYNVTLDEILEAINILKELEPSGIGARNVKECLKFQLEALGKQDSLEMKLIDKHLEKLASKRYMQIAKEENVDIKYIYLALKNIKALEPYPGREFSDETINYVIPDLYVYKSNGDWKISFNNDDMPELRINPDYLKLAKKQKRVHHKNDEEQDESKEYLIDKVRSASWFIKTLEQRQNTIYKVTESIVRFQTEFLEKGIEYLKPMVLKDIANDINMHESTVSRVTSNKYIHTPQGIFELKYFFSNGLKNNEKDVTSSYIKKLILDLISNEDKRSPISDQDITLKLASQNINIARRTVAKYRETLGILPSSKRKLEESFREIY